MVRVVILAALLHLASIPAFAQLRATVFVSGLSLPVAFVQDPSNPAIQFVVEQGGRIRVIHNGAIQPTDFLDLSASISTGGERGLLGLAFPDAASAGGRFYVNFTNGGGHTVIARFNRSSNPLVADPGTRFDLRWPDGNRFITQPFTNHNGGTLAFGPDDYLYIGMGDGGSSNDPDHQAQNPNSLLGKMLRIDVNVADTDPVGYRVPDDNPFLDASPIAALGEIWSFGLRNPWKFTFDDPARGGTGAMLIGDVGQSRREEINYEPAGIGASNYGWRNREGTLTNVETLPPAYTPLTPPIFEYDREAGRSISGGYVYRGSALGSAYVGRYFFADFVLGRVWSLALTIDPRTGRASAGGVIHHTSELGGSSALGTISAFGVDANGELYVVCYSLGRVLRIVPFSRPRMFIDAPSPTSITTLSQPFTIAGWAADLSAPTGTGIDAIDVWAYPNPGSGASPIFVGSASYGIQRPDVGAAHGSQFTNSGFSRAVNGLGAGQYQFVAYGRSTLTGSFDVSRTVTVNITIPTTMPRMAVDAPAVGATVFPSFRVAGWAIDVAASAGTGVDAVDVWAHPASGAAVYLGSASYGGARPDVGAAFSQQFTSSGYVLNVAHLTPGNYTLVVYARSTVSGTFNNAVSRAIRVAADPLMSIDLPRANTNVSRPFTVAGWAIDRAARSGTGVDAVHIYAIPISGGSAVFLGVAAYGGSRPDVGNAFGSRFTNSGFGLTASTLPAGAYDIVVYARSTVTNTYNARVVRVIVN